MSDTTDTQPEIETIFTEMFDDGNEVYTLDDATITIDLSMTGGSKRMNTDEATEMMLALATAIRAVTREP